MQINGMKLGQQIRLIVWISGFALVAMTLISALMEKHDTKQDFISDVDHVLECAVNVAAGYARDAEDGVFSLEEAQEAAMRAISEMRFGNGDYIYITDANNIMLMHPIKAELVGVDMNTSRDKSKQQTFYLRELRENTMNSPDGRGYVNYIWPRPGEETGSPKLGAAHKVSEWDWMICSGVYTNDVSKAFWKSFGTLSVLMLAMLLVLVLLSSVVIRMINTPLAKITKDMGRLAEGELEIDIDFIERQNEIGELARALGVFKENAMENLRLKEDQERLEKQAAEDRRRATLELADRIEERMQSVMESVAAAATELAHSAEEMQVNAGATSDRSASVAAAAEQAAANVATVASAAEELAATVNEISQQVSNAVQVASEAVNGSVKVSGQMEALNKTARQIGEILELINSIAEQTNLLALNATIEAARAGESGKGFAVVAAEVKTLANQTAEATDDIARQINEVQSATQEATSSIQAIRETIEKISEVSSSIAGAVEEQSATTSEIAQNVQQAATGTNDVTRNIADVSDAASSTGSIAHNVSDAAGQLSMQAEEMREAMGAFLVEMRKA